MLRVIVGKEYSVGVASFFKACQFSWFAAESYKGKDLEAEEIKRSAFENITKQLQKKNIAVPKNKIDLILNTFYRDLKENKLETENKIARMLSDFEFSFQDFLIKRFNNSTSLIIEEETKDLTQQNLLEDYFPDPEDYSSEISVSHPAKGMNLPHFTEKIDQHIRTPRNALAQLPDSAVCLMNLPSAGSETFKELLGKYGKILNHTMIKDINSIFFIDYEKLDQPMYFIANFQDKHAAEKAAKELNNFYLKGKLIKIKVLTKCGYKKF